MAAPLFFILFLMPVAVGAFLLFDALVRIEYERHRRAWEDDGKPYGFFWVPGESRSFGGIFPSAGGAFARMACLFSWAFATPEWLEGEPKGRKALLWYRVLLLTWHVGLVALVYLEFTGR